MNYKQFVALVFFEVVISVCIYTEGLQTTSTKYFDIIYAERSAPSAALLAEYADGYADEICSALHKKITKRIPVYLVSDTETLNGYYTPLPYQRIVIYDTAVEDGQLSNLADTILQVFYHELTHAVSLKSPFSILNLLPLSFVEGVAVSFESLHGQGRLNDPLLKQYLIQNKIDGTTPTWQEAAGTRDMYPSGLWPYIYGGFFSAYLQKTYGMDTYAKLWEPSWLLFIAGKFKSIYKKDIRMAWNQFINTIPLPKALKEPTPFEAQTEQSGYAAAAASPNGFAYYDFNRHGVYFVPVEAGTVAVPVRLFTADYSLSHLSFSDDGTLLLVSDSVQVDAGTSRKRSRVFDMLSRRFIGKPLFSSLAACFTDDGQTICSIMLKNQEFSLVLVDRITGEIQKILYTAGPGHSFSALYSPCFIGNNTIAFIAANGVERTIIFVNTVTGVLTALPHDQAPCALRYLQSVKSGGEYILSFSWAEMDMLYRLGLYYPANGELKLQQIDVSGGVLFPVVLPLSEPSVRSIVYTGQHGTYNCLYTITESELTSTMIQPITVSAWQSSVAEPNSEKDANVLSSISMTKAPKLNMLNSRRYQPAEWLWRAKTYPFFSIPVDTKKIGGYGFGLKFIMLDPTEKIELHPTFMFFSKPFFIHGTFTAGFRFKPLSFSVGVSDTLEAKTFTYRKTSLMGTVTYTIPLAYSWESLDITYQGSANKIAFLSDTAATYYSIPYRYTVLAHEGLLRYRNVRSTRIIKTPFFAKNTQGITVSGAAAHAYCIETKTNTAVLQAQMGLYLPVVPIYVTLSGFLGFHAKFNPITGTYSHIVSGFPVTTTNYLPVFDVYANDRIRRKRFADQDGNISAGFSGVCDITLFSYEVQTSIPVSPLFFNRFAFHTGYMGIVFDTFKAQNAGSSVMYLDTVYLNCIFTFNTAMQFKIEYTHPLRTPTKRGKIGLGFQAAL